MCLLARGEGASRFRWRPVLRFMIIFAGERSAEQGVVTAARRAALRSVRAGMRRVTGRPERPRYARISAFSGSVSRVSVVAARCWPSSPR